MKLHAVADPEECARHLAGFGSLLRSFGCPLRHLCLFVQDNHWHRASIPTNIDVNHIVTDLTSVQDTLKSLNIQFVDTYFLDLSTLYDPPNMFQVLARTAPVRGFRHLHKLRRLDTYAQTLLPRDSIPEPATLLPASLKDIRIAYPTEDTVLFLEKLSQTSSLFPNLRTILLLWL